MTNKQVAQLVRSLGGPPLTVVGRFAYARPSFYFARGLCFEGSVFDGNDLYISTLILPLFHPLHYVVLTYAERVCNGHRFELNEVLEHSDEIMREHRAHERHANSPSEFIQYVESSCTGSLNLGFVQEVLAYAYILAGDRARADKIIDVLRNPAGAFAGTVNEEVTARLERISRTSGCAEPRPILNEWVRESEKGLKLAPFPPPSN